MNRIVYFTLALVAAVALVAGCSKDSAKNPRPRQVTLSVSIPEGVAPAKVALSQDEDNWQLIKLAWEDDDIITVNGESFAIVPESISADGKTASFTGNDPGVAPYTIGYTSLPGSYAFQTQAENGNADHLGYGAILSGVDTYEDISFTSGWAASHGGSLSQSSVLCLKAIMPTGEASIGAVKKVIFTADKNVFAGGKTLMVTLGTPSAAETLDVFATLPPTAVDLEEDLNLLVQFQVGDNAYEKYTAHRLISYSAKPHFVVPGATTTIGIRCPNIKYFANASDTSIGEAGNPYLIGDQHQLDYIHTTLAAGATTYYKMVDDVDATGLSWTKLNPTSPYSMAINMDGNHKTISHLGATMFYVFKGSVRNLKLDYPTPSNDSQKGLLTEYIQGTGHVIQNVDVSNVSAYEAKTNCGGLIGRINSGSTGVVSATITDCDITNVKVAGACAGGLIGSAEAKIVVENCSYSGATVTGTTQNVGGLIGKISDGIGCTISGCRVENATVDVSAVTGDVRAGGFIGQLGEGSEVKGCTVGTASQKVNVKAGTSDKANTGKVLNTGGFVGVNYGIITKDDSGNRSKAYVALTSTNTYGTPVNLGGFVGFQRGTIEYADAVVSMGGLAGQYIGGFAGYVVYQSGKTVLTDHCTVVGDGNSETVDIKGNNYTGGFVGVAENGDFTISNCQVLEGTVVIGQSTAGGFAGQIKSGLVEDCSAHVDLRCRGGNDGGFVGAITGGTVRRCSSAGTISQIESTNNVFGGFAGYVNGVDLTKCSSTVDISVARSYVGGLVGEFQTANTISACFYNGTISGPTNIKGGLIGRVLNVAATITDCYTAGALIGSSGTQIYGGIVGELLAGAGVVNCYSTMDISHGGRATGGIVGRACSGGWPVNNESGNTISKCIAWNPNITFDGTASTSASSGAIVGYTSFKNILNNCYRRSDMNYKNSNTATGTTCQTSMVDQVACTGSNWSINGNRPAGGTPAGTSSTAQYQAPYYGVAAAAAATVSSIAQSLDWDGKIWDFTNDLPTLR